MVRPPLKGGDQAALGVCGVTLADAVVRELFGFAPPVGGGAAPAAEPASLLADATSPRGFDGVLRGVRYRGLFYDITSVAAAGLSIAAQ